MSPLDKFKKKAMHQIEDNTNWVEKVSENIAIQLQRKSAGMDLNPVERM